MGVPPFEETPIYTYISEIWSRKIWFPSWQVPTDTEPLEEESDPWEMATVFHGYVAMAKVDGIRLVL